MPAARYIPPINTLDQKLQIQRRLGGLRSCKYFNLLTMYLNMKVTKPDFDRICIAIIGRENVPLHNHFLKSILKKACLSKAAPPRQSIAEGPLKVKMPNGCNGLPPLGKNSRKCRTPNLRDRRFKDRPSPLGPHERNRSIGFENSTPKIQEHQMDIDLCPEGNGLHVSVEHREEVNPDSKRLSINRRSPIRRPLDPHGKNNIIGFENSTPKSQEHQMDTDLHPVRNRLQEHREEVNWDSEGLGINRRTPMQAPLGPHVKNNSTGFENSTPKFQEHQMDTDLHPVRNGFHVSVEHREEDNRDSEGLAINRRTPMRAQLDPHVKNNSTECENSTPKFQEHQMDTGLLPVRNGSHVSVEDREEVNRDSEWLAINRRTPMRAPLGPHVKNNSTGYENSTPKFQEHQIDTDLHPVGNRLHESVEHRKEVIQDSVMLAMNRKTPIRAPLGLPTYDNRAQIFTPQGLQSGIVTGTCQSIGHLPDTYSLMKRVEYNLESEGCNISVDAANVLNTALDVYLKGLIKPCLDMADSKSVNKCSSQIQSGMNELPRNRRVQMPIGFASASVSNLRTAMELNPTILGEDWPLHFERTCFHAFEK